MIFLSGSKVLSVISVENKFAYDAAMMVLEKPGQYSPIYIADAEPGLGVTHLLQGIAWKLRKECPKRKFRFVDGDTFLSQYIHSMNSSIQANRFFSVALLCGKYRI